MCKINLTIRKKTHVQSRTVVVRGQILNYFCQVSSVRPIWVYSNYELKPVVVSLILDWEDVVLCHIDVCYSVVHFFSLGDRDNFWMWIFFFNWKRQVGVVAVRNFCLNLKCNTLSKPKSRVILKEFESGGDLYLNWWNNISNTFQWKCVEGRWTPEEVFKSRIK